MPNTEYSKTKLIKYLIWTFALAYALQIIAAYLYNHVNMTVGQLLVAGLMFVPTLGVVLAGGSLKDVGWRPAIKKNIRSYLIAWLMPVAFTIVGAVLYFLVFPDHFTLSGEYITSLAGPDALSQTEAQGISYPVAILITLAASLTYGPFMNTATALGEELGWRGFMYPQLKARFGKNKGRIIGGLIWGAWHWPLIWLIGYEYGAAVANPIGYWGFPVTGMLLFAVIACGWGILHDWLYERSRSIWVPSLFHGAINAAVTLPLTLCLTNTGSVRLLGPMPMGILSGLPFLFLAALLLFKKEKEPEARVSAE